MPFYVSLSSLTLGNAGYIELFSFLEIGNGYHLTEFICFPFVVSEFRNMFFRVITDDGISSSFTKRYKAINLDVVVVKTGKHE